MARSCVAREVAATIAAVADSLCKPSAVSASPRPGGLAMPEQPVLREIMSRLKAAIFPSYFGKTFADEHSLRFHMAANLDSLHRLLASQIVAGLCFACNEQDTPCEACIAKGSAATLAFMRSIPKIRRLLLLDAQAAYEGDPAASSPGEAIFCYPSLTALFHHRAAHELYKLKIPIIPRIIAEMAHSATGIDIHPGAEIGESFFIDHGTGVVIGETTIIGKSCRIYQGVTLGALSFPKGEDGSLIKGIARHPILEDNVTVYAGATILGRVRIGQGAVIGGNVWITHDVPKGARITMRM